MALTDRDQKVLRVVQKFIERKGYPPSVRQIARVLGLKSSSGVHKSLVRLREEGLVQWEEGQLRTLHLTSSAK